MKPQNWFGSRSIHVYFAWFQINGKDMKIARHEDAVAMLTGGLSYVTLIVVREKVINKRMLPLSKLQDQSLLNKRLGTKVGYGSKLQSNFHIISQASYADVLCLSRHVLLPTWRELCSVVLSLWTLIPHYRACLLVNLSHQTIWSIVSLFVAWNEPCLAREVSSEPRGHEWCEGYGHWGELFNIVTLHYTTLLEFALFGSSRSLYYHRFRWFESPFVNSKRKTN